MDNQIAKFAENIASELPISILDNPRWEVIFKPQKFDPERIPYIKDCWALIDSCRVSLGSFYPLIKSDYRQNGNDWIASWGQIILGDRDVYWRLYQSAQFLHYFSLWEDRDSTVFEMLSKALVENSGKAFKPWGYVDIVYTLYVITELFEFATRLAQKGIFGKSLSILIQMIGVKDRILLDRYSEIDIRSIYPSADNTIGKEWSFEIQDLIGNSPSLALGVATWFYERFGFFNPPLSYLKDKQMKLLERKK